MAGRAFIYGFQNTTSTRINVYYMVDNPTIIDYDVIPSAGIPGGQPPPEITIAMACQPGTTNRLKYHSKTFAPYATYTVEPNSTYCGYVPPACDIELKDFTVTDETSEGGNDGTINIFAVSSFMPITYRVTDGSVITLENTTGYFTGLPPNDYSVSASDAHFCVIHQMGTVHPFDSSKTHFKYRLQFDSIPNEGINSVNWDVHFYDTVNNYDSEEYPKILIGGDTPLTFTQALDDEDKVSPIAVKQFDIQLLYDGETFTPDEFSSDNSKQWYIEVYLNGSIEFKGYLLPDEVQDYYADAPYYVSLKATDGLPSLKGNKWGDGSGGNGYTTDQVPQYGLTKWCLLVKQCLDQLGYDYGLTKIVSSLQYNGAYNLNIWRDIGTWSDILYGSDGVPNDTYNCLELLLQGMGLTIMQHKGEFILLNWNTMSYANNGTVAATYKKAFYEFSADFSTITQSTNYPVIQPIGDNYQLQPVNPIQSLRKDKAYNIKGHVDFNLLALLYPNPSFEIGAVEGELPSDFGESFNMNAYCHKDEENAYDGSWVLRIQGEILIKRETVANIPVFQQNDILFMFNEDRWTYTPAFFIDQTNKKAKISFNWRTIKYSDEENACPTITIFFTPTGTSDMYIYSLVNKHDDENKDTLGGWFGPDYDHAFTMIPQRLISDEDYINWNSVTIETDRFPFGATGDLFIAFRTPGFSSMVSPRPNDTIVRTIDIDNYEISIEDASPSYSKQTAENHLINAVRTNPSTKEVGLQLFTYPQNKRVAGNIFTSDDYETGVVANKWNYALRSYDDQDRLAATISKGVARAYQRPLRFFEGDVQAQTVDFYGMFTIRYIENEIFMPYSIEFNCLHSTGTIVIVGIDDSTQQAVYKYVPIYEKSARKNTN